MKRSKSADMKVLMALAKEKASKIKRINDGLMVNLIYLTLDDGTHYQADLIHDTRCSPKPYITVYKFSPAFTGSTADFYLKEPRK